MLLLSNLSVVAFIDPAGGKTALKKTASRSADVVVGGDVGGRVFVLHAWAGRIPTTSHTDRIFQLVERWTPRVVGIDASAMQTLYADSLLREARQRGARLPLVPKKMQGDKDERIRTVLQPVIDEGRLFVRDEQRDLRQELEAFPGGATKDLVDALAEAITLLPKRTPQRAAREDGAAWLNYLRDSGAPEYYIRECERTLVGG
jgi:predicted phage terminase large subunit-like protein